MPRIYVSSIAHYNAGRLYGEWIDLEGKDADDLQQSIDLMLSNAHPLVDGSKPEEWRIDDHEGFGCFKVAAHIELELIVQLAELIEEEDDCQLAAVWYLNHVNGYTLSEALERRDEVGIEEAERNADASYAAYAENAMYDVYSEQLEALPAILKYAIDWKEVGKELRIGGDIYHFEFGGDYYLVTNVSEM